MNRTLPERIAFCACLLFSIETLAFGQRVNSSAKNLADFDQRVSAYVKLHNKARAGLPQAKTSNSPGTITSRENQLAEKIRALRPDAKQGQIFTPQVSTEFRYLINQSWHGSDAVHMKTSLARAEPVRIPFRVNGAYPTNIPLQTTPPTLLQNLPVLPKELEYRVIGHSLVLRDISADLIVDFAERVIP